MTTLDILKRTKAAWPSICNASAEDKNRILSAMADSLQAQCDAILRCNAEDMDAARGHISDVMLDRLYLDRGRIDAMADGIRATVALPDHTGRILAQIDHPNGMKIYKKQVPLGLVAIIYESRPNVTSDAAALAIKSGNVCMLRSGKELKVFAIGDRDLEKFCREAKKYGILYCVLKDKTANDGHTDVFVRAEDASKINRIFDRFGIATADIGSARTEIVKAKEEQKNADVPVPDRSTTEKDKEEAFLDALLAPAPNKEEAQTQNPTQGPAAKSRPSEPTSNQREKTVRGISDPTERSRPSVRQEMKEIREEQRQRTSSAQKTKDEPNRTSEHRPVPKKKKDKER